MSIARRVEVVVGEREMITKHEAVESSDARCR